MLGRIIRNIILLCMLGTIGVHAKIKNIYILVEPSSALDNKHILTPILSNTKMLLRWISADGRNPRFRRAFIRVVGVHSQYYKKADVGKMGKQNIMGRVYRLIKNQKKYSIASGLSHFSQDLEGHSWKGEETLLLIIGDIDFVKNGISSHGKYLNSAWLTQKRSPYKRNFLDRDNQIARGTSVVILNRTQLNLKAEKQREGFLYNLFSKAGMRPYYIGDFYNQFVATQDSKENFLVKLIDGIRKGTYEPMTKINIPDSQLCQIVSDESLTIKNCGR